MVRLNCNSGSQTFFLTLSLHKKFWDDNSEEILKEYTKKYFDEIIKLYKKLCQKLKQKK
jgi:hypothetical protein